MVYCLMLIRMLSNRINSMLFTDFSKYIETTMNVCIYNFNNNPSVPQNIIFSNASSVTLVNCNKDGIKNILTPIIFPNLKTINYLSLCPGNYSIEQRFAPNVQWNFPNKYYSFYDFMVQNGYGKKNNFLIKDFVTSDEIDVEDAYNYASYNVDLIIPNLGIIDGNLWQLHFASYLKQKHNNYKHYADYLYPGESNAHHCTFTKNNKLDTQEEYELSLQKEHVKSIISDMQFYNEQFYNDSTATRNN